MTKPKKISKAQLAAVRLYAEYTDRNDGTTFRPGGVRLDTHCALLSRGLLEVASVGELRTVYHTYGYNFGRCRITKGHLESTARFRLTDAGRALLETAKS
jgi:hypothetical protein